MKHLPKHLRPRYRYLALELETWPDATVDRRAFQREIWQATRDLFGDPGSAEIDPSLIHFEHAEGTGEAIVRVRHDAVERARGALACIDAVDEAPIGVRIGGVSGTIRSCEEKYMGGRPIPVGERTVAFENARRTAVVRDGLVDVRTDDAFAGATDFDLTD